MRGKNRKNIKYPSNFMKVMKLKKHKKLRNASIDDDIIEKQYNDANRVI